MVPLKASGSLRNIPRKRSNRRKAIVRHSRNNATYGCYLESDFALSLNRWRGVAKAPPLHSARDHVPWPFEWGELYKKTSKPFGFEVLCFVWQYKTDLQENDKTNLLVTGAERRAEWRKWRTELQAERWVEVGVGRTKVFTIYLYRERGRIARIYKALR